MTLDTCLHLGKQVSDYSWGRNTIERLEDALTMVSDESQPDVSYLCGSLPGCYIVREDQYDLHQKFCAMLAQIGVMRVTFLASRYELAMLWVSGAR